jgi:hypothetical protein
VSSLFLESLSSYLILAWRTFADRRYRPSPLALLAMVGFLPLFAMVQAIHWIGFLLDEVLFPGYRRVTVRRPIFVLGPPRSGTTLVHRVLARDDQFTTLHTWECLFAPSVTQRRFWMALDRLDRWLGRYVGRGIERLERGLAGHLDAVTPFAWTHLKKTISRSHRSSHALSLYCPFPSLRGCGASVFSIGR